MITRLAASISAILLGTSHAGLIAHFKFDETIGTTATNSVAGAADCTINGATIDVEGKIGRAYSFDGADDWVDADDAPFLADITASGQITMSAWIKTTDTEGNRNVAVFAGDSSNSSRYIDLTLNGPGGVAVGRSRTSSISEQFGDDVINDGENWHYLVFVVNTNLDERSINLYVDGVLDNDGYNRNTTPSGFPTLNNFEIGRLGRSAPADYFTGQIDDVQIYDSALSAEQVAAMFANPGSIAIEPAPDSFKITEIIYDQGTDMITVAWGSEPGGNYGLFFSTDLKDFVTDVDDSIPSQGATTSMTFPRPGDVTDRVFFHVIQNQP